MDFDMSTTSFQIAQGSKATQWFAIGFTAFLLTIPIAIALFVMPHGPVTFRIEEGGLTITGDSYGRSFTNAELNKSAVRAVNLNLDQEFKLVRRTNGLGLPGYRSGWFDTKSEGKVLVFATDLSKIVCIPTTLGYSILISPEDPYEFITALGKTSGGPDEHLLVTEGNAGNGYPPGVAPFFAFILILPTVIALLILWICMRSRKIVFEFDVDTFRIKGDFYGRSIPRESLMAAEARMINLKQGTDRINLIRVNGIGMPGYIAGWCRSVNLKTKYLVFITEPTRVVSIPTSLGYSLLLSPAAPESFLQALRIAPEIASRFVFNMLSIPLFAR
jgi:hypothetical protein